MRTPHSYLPWEDLLGFPRASCGPHGRGPALFGCGLPSGPGCKSSQLTRMVMCAGATQPDGLLALGLGPRAPGAKDGFQWDLQERLACCRPRASPCPPRSVGPGDWTSPYRSLAKGLYADGKTHRTMEHTGKG